MLKLQLLDAPGLWGERRYRVRVNGRRSTKVRELTVTEVIARLRAWLVGRARRSWARKRPAQGLESAETAARGYKKRPAVCRA